MIHGLAPVFAGVDDHAIAFGEPLGARDVGRGPEQMAEQRAIVFLALGERNDVFARGQQNMHRSLRMNVRKGIALLVLIDGGGGDTSVNDLAKEATHSAFSVQE